MSKLASPRLAALRQKFRQFEHGGQCFGSEDISGIVRELGELVALAKALEDEVAGQRRRPEVRAAPPLPPPPPPAFHPKATAIGTFYFVPAGQPIGGH